SALAALSSHSRSSSSLHCFLSVPPRPPRSPSFPYTPLFRSLPLLLTRLKAKDRRKHVATALDVVNLPDRAAHYPREMSGGQQQRSEEHTSELQSLTNLVCRLLLEKKNTNMGCHVHTQNRACT